jgi:hypothetical protein
VSNTFLSEQISTNHQPPAKRTGYLYYKTYSISTNRHILWHYKKDSAEIKLAFSSLISVYGFFHYGRFASTVFC